MQNKLKSSIHALDSWVTNHNYRAYDPGDGQLCPLKPLAFGNPFLKRLLTAVVLRAPFNIRPLIGIQPHTSTKGMGYMAWGYVKWFAQTGDNHYADRARFCLDWLISNRAPKYRHYCWGNSFDFTTRGGTIPAYEPTIVWSSLIGQAFLEAFKTLNDEKYLEVAASVADWILTLPREQTDRGLCLSYVAYAQSSIHNSNMLGSALLANVGTLTGRKEAIEVAKDAMEYSCSRLNPDGSWFYGEHPKYHWIDNFHTGYNLDSLKRYMAATGDHDYDAQLNTAFGYFKRTFFETDGRPRYYHDRIYPIDIQCAAQAVDTLSSFTGEDSEALEMAQKVASWTIGRMRDADGHFYYRDLGWTMVKTPMFHWGQATMFKALVHLIAETRARTYEKNPTNLKPRAPLPGVGI